MFLSTVILIMWIVLTIIGQSPFEWFWIIISYIVETVIYFILIVIFAILSN